MSSFTVPIVINGEHATAEQVFDVVSPGTGEKVHQCALSTAETAVRAVEAAADAFPAWSQSQLTERRRIFLEAARLMAEEKASFVEAMSQEISAPGPWASFNVDTTISIIEGVAGVLNCLSGEVTTLQDPNSSGMILYEPYGVALAIAPWYVYIIVQDGESAIIVWTNIAQPSGMPLLSSAHDLSCSL
jgi:acyl-CoA reductase-like NAD-dependent aldehyde dehydrogenase